MFSKTHPPFVNKVKTTLWLFILIYSDVKILLSFKFTLLLSGVYDIIFNRYKD